MNMAVKNLKTIMAITAIICSANAFAANPAQPFLPSDNVQDPNCAPADSNCYVAVDGIQNGGNSTGNTLVIGTNDAQALQLETDGLTRMTVTPSGMVGIGTTTPVTTLEVVGDSYLGTGNALMRLVTTGTTSSALTGIQFFAPNSGAPSGSKNFMIANQGYIDVYTGGTSTLLSFAKRNDAGGFGGSMMSLTAGGRLALEVSGGSLQPETKLSIVGENATSSQLTLRSFRTAIVSGNIIGGINFASNDTNLTVPGSTTANILAIANSIHTASVLGTDLSFSVTNGTTLSEALRILANGNIGIGTSTPADKLQVFGDIRIGTSSTNGCLKDFSGTSITGTCSSDERLKTNIVDLSDGYLDKMSQLKTITYNWNDVARDVNKVDTSVTNYGLLAQNVESVFPELVSTDSNGFKQVNYSRLPLYLLKSLQELSKKVAGIFDGTSVIYGKDVKAKDKLCVGNTCVTESQLQQLLQGQNVINTYSAPAPVEVAATSSVEQIPQSSDGAVPAPDAADPVPDAPIDETL